MHDKSPTFRCRLQLVQLGRCEQLIQKGKSNPGTTIGSGQPDGAAGIAGAEPGIARELRKHVALLERENAELEQA
jgi:hypothetical protein